MSTVYILKYPVIVHNLGNGFEAAFLTPEVPAHLFDRAMDNKYWQKAREKYAKKHKDVQVTYEREGNRLSIVSSYAYTKGSRPKKVGDRLEELFAHSSWVGRMALVATRLEEGELQKELYKAKPTQLSGYEQLLILANTNIEEFKEEHDEATAGYWSWQSGGRNFDQLNYGDRFVLSYRRKLPTGIAEDVRAEYLECRSTAASRARKSTKPTGTSATTTGRSSTKK
jgi:hypothetical protein